MKQTNRTHLGLVLGLVQLATALTKLAYWVAKVVTVTANYRRRPHDDQKLYAEVPA